MSDWIKDLFLNKPVLNPWISWTLHDLQLAAKDENFSHEDRKRIRIEIQARQQGKRLQSGKDGGR